MTVRGLYHQESGGWWADSPDIDGWTVAGQTYEEVRRLVEDGVVFALAGAAENAEAVDEQRIDDVVVEHYVRAPA